MINTARIKESKKISGKTRLKMDKYKFAKVSKRVLVSIFRYTLIVCLSYMILYPMLRMIVTAIGHPHTIGTVGAIWVPPIISLDNFRVAWAIIDFVPHLIFTITRVAFIVILQMLNAALAGYAFARLRFRGSGILFVLVLLTIVVPTQVLMLPQFVLFRNFDILGIFTLITGEPLNLLGQPTAMYLMALLGQGIAGGIFIYIFRQFFRGLPKELEEAAYVDGAGVLRTFFVIVLPLAKPSFLTVGTLSFIWNYNDSFFPSLFHPTGQWISGRISALVAPSGGTSTIQLAIDIARARIPFDTIVLESPAYDAAIFTVATLLAILPLVLLFLPIQKHFVQGVERSGITG